MHTHTYLSRYNYMPTSDEMADHTYLYVHTRTYICMYICIHTYLHVYVCIHTFRHIYTFVYVNIHTHTHTHQPLQLLAHVTRDGEFRALRSRGNMKIWFFS